MFSETISGHKRGKKTKKSATFMEYWYYLKTKFNSWVPNYAVISNRTLQNINVSSFFFSNRILPLISWKKTHIQQTAILKMYQHKKFPKETNAAPVLQVSWGFFKLVLWLIIFYESIIGFLRSIFYTNTSSRLLYKRRWLLHLTYFFPWLVLYSWDETLIPT